jgi:aldose 1-epimerase
MPVRRRHFGRLPDGEGVDLYVLADGGVELRAIPYGGVITALVTSDRRGNRASIVLGHDRLDPYIENRPYLGALIGRYANRIAGARFRLDGQTHVLHANDGPHHLHGGVHGFHRRLWSATAQPEAAPPGVVFTRTSVDGEEGYPGAVDVRVSYGVTAHEVAIEYEATSTAATIMNMTQHTYFDLSGGAARDVLSHELTIDAGAYLPVDETLIPVGAPASVAGTPFDFRDAAAIGSRMAVDDTQLRRARGYDHTWVLDKPAAFSRAARVWEPTSGRSLEVWTTEPGLQFYAGNQLDGSITAAGRRVLRRHAGFCLEPHHFPDSPNRDDFPSAVLRPGETYRSRTVWRLGCE